MFQDCTLRTLNQTFNKGNIMYLFFRLILPISWLVFSGFNTLHPMYISLGLIDFNPKTQSLDITFKVFTDDLQDAVRKASSRDDLFIGYEDEIPAVDSLINVYFNDQVAFEVPDLSVNGMSYLGKEIELDVTWCYFQVQGIPDFTELQATCKLFTEMFATQTTIMHVKKNGKEKTMMFNKSRTEQELKFK